MQRKDKKGQAAMEFLMTYGWAILAAIVVIGILGVYFFRSDVLTPKSAVVSPPFYVNAWNADVSEGGITLEFKNNGGENYNVTSVGISSATVGGTTRACTADTSPDPTGGINAGSSAVFLIDCSLVTGDVGETFKGDITISYTKSGSLVGLSSTGSVTESIIA